MSYYAIFKGWLLLSQPPNCRSRDTTFYTQYTFRDLRRRSGLFPFRPVKLSPHGLTARLHLPVFGVWLRRVPCGPSLIQCSTPGSQHLTLALKLFRGEPAIAEFDWNFSANHSSSPDIARSVGSVLHSTFVELQPGHG